MSLAELRQMEKAHEGAGPANLFMKKPEYQEVWKILKKAIDNKKISQDDIDKLSSIKKIESVIVDFFDIFDIRYANRTSDSWEDGEGGYESKDEFAKVIEQHKKNIPKRDFLVNIGRSIDEKIDKDIIMK